MPASGNTPPNRQARPFTVGQGYGAPREAANEPSIEESLATAATRPLDFPAAERASYIRAMVKRAIEYKSAGRTAQEIRTLLPEFVRDYPYLFDTVTQEGGFDSANLTTMLAMLDRMGQGSLTPHQATTIVGKRLAEKYIRKAGE